MLSRIADSLYWIGRFIERAEVTARILTVHYHQNVETRTTEAESGIALLEMMGISDDVFQFNPSASAVTSLLAYSPGHAGSIVNSLDGAWRNARGARETLSADFWERLNATHELMADKARSVDTQYEFLHWVQERTSMLSGTAESTLIHDESYEFMILGRSLERADMISRLIGSPYSRLYGASGAVTLLRCAWGYEAFVRARQQALDASAAAEFLFFDKHFPRSVAFSLSGASGSLERIDDGSGAANEAMRILELLRAELEYSKPQDLMADVPLLVEKVQAEIAEIHYAVSANYFMASPAIEWSL